MEEKDGKIVFNKKELKFFRKDLLKNFAFLVRNENGEILSIGFYSDIRIGSLGYLLLLLEREFGGEWHWTYDRLQKVIIVYRYS